MRRSQNTFQQVLVGIGVMVCIVGTLACGVILAFGDRLRAEGGLADRPTATVYKIPTLTGAAPTEIAEATVIVIPTTTRVPTRLAESPTPTGTPLPIATDPPTSMATAPSAACNPPANWVIYRVQSGETLFQIGFRYNLTVDEMMDANCLTHERINAGDLLRVPPVTPRVYPTATLGPTDALSLPTPRLGPTGTQSTTDGSCTNPYSFISSPRVGEALHGSIHFRGTANLPNFDFYKMEIRRDGASTAQDYVTFFTGQEPMTSGVLATLNTTTYPDGDYWVRLVVVDTTGNYPERCAILFPFANN